MKYFNTLLEEQEVTINILYEEQVIIIYSNRKEVIQNLTEKIGKPTERYKKGKTYWMGAKWELHFKRANDISQILNKEIFIDNKFKIRNIKNNEEEKYEQISFNF